MIKFIKQELPFEKSLKQRLDFICKFCKTKPTFINGNIIKIDKTNLAYFGPHRIIIKGLIYLIKKKLKKQINIIVMKWKNLLKNFILKKTKKKTMAYHYK